MKKIYTYLLILFNLVYFFVDYILVTYLPNPLLFGWLTLHLGILLFLPVLASIVWGVYYYAFFNTQKQVP